MYWLELKHKLVYHLTQKKSCTLYLKQHCDITTLPAVGASAHCTLCTLSAFCCTGAYSAVPQCQDPILLYSTATYHSTQAQRMAVSQGWRKRKKRQWYLRDCTYSQRVQVCHFRTFLQLCSSTCYVAWTQTCHSAISGTTSICFHLRCLTHFSILR